MSNHNASRLPKRGSDATNDRHIVLPDEAMLDAALAAAGKLRSAGWKHSAPIGLLDESGRVTIPVVFGTAPVPDSGGYLHVAIRSWDWNAECPHFELTTHGEDAEMTRLIFGSWNGTKTSLETNDGLPTPQQAIQMLGARGAARIVRRKAGRKLGRHR